MAVGHRPAQWMPAGLSINARSAESRIFGAMISAVIVLTLLCLLVATEHVDAT